MESPFSQKSQEDAFFISFVCEITYPRGMENIIARVRAVCTGSRKHFSTISRATSRGLLEIYRVPYEDGDDNPDSHLAPLIGVGPSASRRRINVIRQFFSCSIQFVSRQHCRFHSWETMAVPAIFVSHAMMCANTSL